MSDMSNNNVRYVELWKKLIDGSNSTKCRNSALKGFSVFYENSSSFYLFILSYVSFNQQ